MFDESYFRSNFDKLFNLLEYLSRNRNINLESVDICKSIRKNVLGLKGQRAVEADKSLGEFVAGRGGIDVIIDIPIYELSPSIAAFIFIKQ